MGEAKIEIRSEGTGQTVAEIEKIRKATEKLAQQQFETDQRMKWDKATDAIGRLASKFSGFTQEAIDGVEKVAKGFLVGGPLLGGLAAVIEVTGLITRKLEEQDKAWKEEHDAAVKAADAQQAALKAVAAETQQLALEERALTIARKDGVSISVARAQAEKESVVTTREEQVAKIALLRARLKQERDAIVSEQGTRLVELKGTELAIQELNSETINAHRAKIAELEAAISEQADTMIGSAQRVRNAEKKIEIERTGDKQNNGKAAQKARQEELNAAFERDQDQRVAMFKNEQAREVEVARLAEQEKVRIRTERIKNQQDQDKANEDFRQAQADKAEKEEQFRRDLNQNKVEKLNKRLTDERDRQQKEDADQKDKIAAAEVGAANASLGVLKDIVTGQGDVTKAALESKAEQAAIEAAFQTAVGTASLLLNPPGAAAAFAAAAQFAAIAATAGVASLAAGSSAPSAAPAQASGGTSRGSGGGSGGGTNITVVLPQSGRLYPMNDELLRGVRAANREASRR